MRVVLAYSGSLEASAAIGWLRRRREAEVVAVTLDLGQGRELEAVRDRALAVGAQRAHVLDAREAFADGCVLPALRAGARHASGAPMGQALSRPIIAAKLVDIAAIERADAVAHAGGSGTSRLHRLLADLDPGVPVLDPVREWNLTEADLIAFGRRHGFRPATAGGWRDETTFWGRTSRREPPAGPAAHATGDGPPPAADGAGEPVTVAIAFDAGAPVALNGVAMPLVELAAALATLAAAHGIGRVDTPGFASDAPAAVLIHAAHDALTSAVYDPDLARVARGVAGEYARLVENGGWFTPLRPALDAFVTRAQAAVSGEVRLGIHSGTFQLRAVERSPRSAVRPEHHLSLG